LTEPHGGLDVVPPCQEERDAMQSFVPYPPGVETIGNNEEETFGDIKVFGVDGEMLPVHAGATTQDWALDTGAVFNAPKAGFFPDAISATQTATPMPESVKTAVSAASRGANAALNAVGLNSSNLDFFGHPKLHQPVEAYYSQAPIRWGPYFGKLAFIPDTEALRALAEQDLPLDDENAPRTAAIEWLAAHPADFAVAVPLCTDLDLMPVEHVDKEWSEDERPYPTVGRLVISPQNAWTDARQDFVDENLSFSPSHSSAAHRPLGSICAPRMHAHKVFGRRRREANRRPTSEPSDIAQMRA
jgi:hypothetical protein